MKSSKEDRPSLSWDKLPEQSCWLSGKSLFSMDSLHCKHARASAKQKHARWVEGAAPNPSHFLGFCGWVPRWLVEGAEEAVHLATDVLGVVKKQPRGLP